MTTKLATQNFPSRRARIAHMSRWGQSTLDTDMTDEAAWQARPELAKQSNQRKAKEKATLSKKVAADKAGVKAHSHTVVRAPSAHIDEWRSCQTLPAHRIIKLLDLMVPCALHPVLWMCYIHY